MSSSESAKARSGMCLIFGISTGLLVLHLNHALRAGEDFQTFLLGILIPMSFALSVLAGGVWLWRQQMDGEYVLRVGVWCVFGVLILATGAAFTILYQQAEGVSMSDRLFVGVNAASGGAVIGFIIGVYDNRHRVARAEATQSSRQLTVLNRVLRHDIRNNANVIKGNAELLIDNPMNTVERARTIRQQTAHLVELGEHAKEIEQLLHGKDTDREIIDITATIETCCERLARNHPDADINISLPESELVYSYPLVKSALRNVIENAIKHNDKQTPRVDIESVDGSTAATDSVEIRIADNGPGIPTNEREVLERGYETELEHASGLGLWLVNWIMRESDGEIRFEENSPEGSVVCLRFERAHA